MKTGVIKTVKDRGFGFIRVDNGSEVFFHCSALKAGLAFSEDLVERRVMFDVQQTDRGLQAVDIRPGE